jgi:hypothetical protein
VILTVPDETCSTMPTIKIDILRPLQNKMQQESMPSVSRK